MGVSLIIYQFVIHIMIFMSMGVSCCHGLMCNKYIEHTLPNQSLMSLMSYLVKVHITTATPNVPKTV